MRLFALALVFSPLAPPAQAADAPLDGTLAITDVAVIDVVAGKLLERQTVVVKGDAIVAVGDAKSVALKPCVPTIDGTGKFLIPGLWDMHAHVADPVMPGLFLRYGVTGIRHMYSPLGGVALKPANPAKERERPTFPRVVAAPNLIDGKRSGFPNIFQTNILFANTPDEGQKAVVKVVTELGNDFVKVHSLLERDVYFAVVKEAKSRKVPFAGHVPFGLTAAEVSDAGQLTIEHLDGVAVLCSARQDEYLKQMRQLGDTERDKRDANLPWRLERKALDTFDPKRAEVLFAKFVANGTWHTPTLVESRSKHLIGNPKALAPEVEKLLPLSAKYLWRRAFEADGTVRLSAMDRKYTKAELQERKELFEEEKKLVGAMHKAKVKLLAGTDTPNVLVFPGLSLHEELEIFVQAGLTPAEALRTATCNPAECLGLADKHGSVSAGKRADFVLLSKNPLADIRNTTAIDTVFVGGAVAYPVPKGK